MRDPAPAGAAESDAHPAPAAEDADLARVLANWDTLPEPIRQRLLGMIEASELTRKQQT